MSDVRGFAGEFEFLSNFYNSPIKIDGICYDTVEHYYQASKTLVLDHHHKIRSAKTPGHAKKLGRKYKLREDWESVKEAVMLKGIRAKFDQNPTLKQLLLDTGDSYLEETNTWNDKYWGVCEGKGKNRLGVLLMQLRTEYRMDKFME